MGAACPTCLCRPPPALFREAPCCVYTHHGLLRVEPCLPGICMWACSPQDPSMWPRLQRRCWLMALHEVMPRGVAWAWSPGVFLRKGEIWLQTLTHRAGQVNTKAGCVGGGRPQPECPAAPANGDRGLRHVVPQTYEKDAPHPAADQTAGSRPGGRDGSVVSRRVCAVCHGHPGKRVGPVRHKHACDFTRHTQGSTDEPQRTCVSLSLTWEGGAQIEAVTTFREKGSEVPSPQRGLRPNPRQGADGSLALKAGPHATAWTPMASLDCTPRWPPGDGPSRVPEAPGVKENKVRIRK